jgi:hypothetical protein
MIMTVFAGIAEVEQDLIRERSGAGRARDTDQAKVGEQWRARLETDDKPCASQPGCSDTLTFDLSRMYAQR